MLKVNELRIGNWVDTPIPMQVISLDENYVFCNFKLNKGSNFKIKIEDIKAIPLTSDILEKAGFKNGFNSNEYWYHPKMRTFAKSKYYIYLPYKVWDSIVPCEHVHQLQNLYFAITGEELEIHSLVDGSTIVSVGKKLKETNDE